MSIPAGPDRLSRVETRSTNPEEDATRYLCLIYRADEAVERLSRPEFDALVTEALAYDDALRGSGHYLASGALQSVQTATTIRIKGGRTLATDGPFAETKEQLGGFILIEARDLDDAIRVASKIPPARLGCIEVRPIRELPMPPRSP